MHDTAAIDALRERVKGQVVKAREGHTCPLCGSAISPEAARIASVLSRRQMQIYALLVGAHSPMTVGELADAMFAAEDRGGPDWADGIVTTAIARMRKKIKQHKLPMRIWTAPEGGYRIELLSALKETAHA